MNKAAILLMLCGLWPGGAAFGQSVTLVAGSNKTATTPSQTNVLVAVTRAAKVFEVSGFNYGGADAYVHIYDTNATPAAGALPTLHAIRVPANSQFSWAPLGGYNFRTGISVAASSSADATTYGPASMRFAVSYYDRPF